MEDTSKKQGFFGFNLKTLLCIILAIIVVYLVWCAFKHFGGGEIVHIGVPPASPESIGMGMKY